MRTTNFIRLYIRPGLPQRLDALTEHRIGKALRAAFSPTPLMIDFEAESEGRHINRLHVAGFYPELRDDQQHTVSIMVAEGAQVDALKNRARLVLDAREWLLQNTVSDVGGRE